MEQSYSFGGHLVGIRTTSEPFGAWLDETLAEYRAEINRSSPLEQRSREHPSGHCQMRS